MKGQPGFHQLERFSPTVRPANVSGRLYLRDGLPLLDKVGSGTVGGQVLSFQNELLAAALDVICQFEPSKLYKWCQVETVDGHAVNALVGLDLDKGGAEPAPGNRWALDMDPVFSEALAVVRATADTYAVEAFPNSPEHVDWHRAFHIQMAYLLLWSVLERFSALAVGPAVEPHERITKMGKLELVLDAVHTLEIDNRKVADSRRPKKIYALNVKEKPEKAMHYYYAVRSNLSHRGKSAWRDAETVRLSLNELLTVTTAVLATMRKQVILSCPRQP
jgi:hypothetical protein